MPATQAAIDECRQRIASAGWEAVARRSREGGKLLWLVRCSRRNQVLYCRHEQQARAWETASETLQAIQTGKRYTEIREQQARAYCD